jgi:hypothetical protein
MTSCTACGVTVNCPPGSAGCYVVCDADCSFCWVGCTAVTKSKSNMGRAEEPRAGTDAIEVSTSDLAAESLHEVLQAFLGTDLTWTDEGEREPVTLSFSGTVDDLLEQVGLRRTEGGYPRS